MAEKLVEVCDRMVADRHFTSIDGDEPSTPIPASDAE